MSRSGLQQGDMHGKIESLCTKALFMGNPYYYRNYEFAITERKFMYKGRVLIFRALFRSTCPPRKPRDRN